MGREKLLDSVNYPSDLKGLTGEELAKLCEEIRELLIETISQNGGHLASNLGVVELTVALHRVFETPKDQIVWDVGHQSYTHKILTGRKDRFSTIRQQDGLSGYPKQAESEHDAFVAGHSSTSISVAAGLARAKTLKKEDGHVIAVIGDGALTGGMAYEGLNNAGRFGDRLIVILNDNEMSISRNVGGLARYLSKIRSNPEYFKLKDNMERFLLRIPLVGRGLYRFLYRTKAIVKEIVYHNTTFFEEMGFVYLGPVDGHDLRSLCRILRRAKRMQRPVLIHAETKKGKGYQFAERKPTEFHGVPKFDVDTGNPDAAACDSFSSVFGDTMEELAHADERICAVTAAMGQGTGLKNFARDFKKRYFDVGIAEAHAVTFCAALASRGLLPVFAVYSSFLQRGYDQIIHDCAIEREHVVFAIDRAGVVGEDGETHQGIFDVSFLSSIPGVVAYAPFHYMELRNDLKRCLYQEDGPCAVRYPRGSQGKAPKGYEFQVGLDYHLFSQGRADILLVTYGRLFQEAANAAISLREQGIGVHVLKLNRILPFPQGALEAALRYPRVFFAEEAFERGGVSQTLGELLLLHQYSGTYRVRAVTQFVPQATVKASIERLGMDAQSLGLWILGEVGR